MEISKFNWRTDNAGNLRAMAGFQVRAADLAKLSQLVLQKGSWNGKQLIEERWINELLSQGQPYTKKSGLLWWRISSESKYIVDDEHLQKMRSTGFDEEFLASIEKIKGRYNSQGAVVQALVSHLTRSELRRLKKETEKYQMNPWKSESGPIAGYKAEGDLVQYLIIYPEYNIVAVRMIKYSDNYNRKTDMFGNFDQMVYRLANKK